MRLHVQSTCACCSLNFIQKLLMRIIGELGRMTFWRVILQPQTSLTGLTSHLTEELTNQNALTLIIIHVISCPRSGCFYKNGHLRRRLDLSEFRRSFSWEKRVMDPSQSSSVESHPLVETAGSTSALNAEGYVTVKREYF